MQHKLYDTNKYVQLRKTYLKKYFLNAMLNCIFYTSEKWTIKLLKTV